MSHLTQYLEDGTVVSGSKELGHDAGQGAFEKDAKLKLWRSMFERSMGFESDRPLNRFQQWQSDQFGQVVSNFELKRIADELGLSGFGDFETGRSFEDELGRLRTTDTPFGGGFRTSRNVDAFGALSDDEAFRLDEALGTGGQEMRERAITNALVGKFGLRSGTNIASRQLSKRARGAFDLEQLESGRFETSFTRSLLDRLRDQFGVGRGIVQRAGPSTLR